MIDNTATASVCKPEKWYNHYSFPLVPQITIRRGDEWNTTSHSFHWLIFKFWTLDSVQFEISANIDTHWGIGFCGILPYLRWVISIPLPVSFQMWVQQNLWRKPTKQH
jgi:hypothetical protein